MLEQRLYLAELFDIYGPLLTDKQQKCLSMHLFEDFSMSEIGEDLAVSRQAVYDILHRSEQIMTAYEEKLGLAKRLREQKRELSRLYDEISGLSSPDEERKNDILMRLAPYTSRLQEELD
ncbi:YlxM family DNA-binding protein [Anaerovibrio sp.]|uniref:YlxM family DNA-binding protein n=1 Tax=Anaerovibrio sp. TaxID=1872532 RepID=UPI0025C4F272|nr:sigma factor-like helix-turn-helix DNA-binding protein [Anaerovibrio sp.]MBR2143761.1 transcriptional regulator [Anaerovibrio sp.]